METAISTMIGMATQKEHALTHLYPSKIEMIDKFGYDPKQLHHILRLEEFMERYIAGFSYADCLKSQKADYLKSVKLGEYYDLETAKSVASKAIEKMRTMEKEFIANFNASQTYVDGLINIVQEGILHTAVLHEWED